MGNSVKYLLLILISFILLSSPVIGQETGVLYLYESSSGFVLKSFGDGKVQPKYKGEITNGRPNGFGVLTYPYGEKSVVGEWKNGKEWNTKHTKKDGEIIGKVENGEWIGNRGVLYRRKVNGEWGYYKSGDEGWDSKYVGEIKNGKPNGKGTKTYNNGNKYVGEVKNGKRWGQGTLTWSDGTKLCCEWKGGWFWNGTKYDKNGNLIEKVVNGEWIEQ